MVSAESVLEMIKTEPSTLHHLHHFSSDDVGPAKDVNGDPEVNPVLVMMMVLCDWFVWCVELNLISSDC